MKKIISILVFATLPVVAYSQVPLVEYKPVIIPRNNSNSITIQNVPSYSNPGYSNRQSNSSNYQVVGAYFFDTNSKSFKRTKIKINLGESYFGETEIYVRGILDRSFHRENWKDCNNRAIKVSSLFDNEIILDNFEWKVENVTIGGYLSTVYFNY